MTRPEKEIDRITRDAGIELTRTTITKLAAIVQKYADKAFEAGADYGFNGGENRPPKEQWMQEQKIV